MFTLCHKLIGGQGTTFDDTHTDYTYARIDGGVSAPGYFTYRGATHIQPYAVYTEENKTLTFYYDDQKEARKGMDFEPVVNRPSATSVPWKYSAGPIETVVFDSSMADCHSITSTAYWFHDMVSLTAIVGIENLNTENVTDMSFMFAYCNSLCSIDLSHLDTQNVTDMTGLFHYCTSLPNIDMSGLDTRNVTSMNRLFCDCYKLSNIELGNINTSNLTDASWLFSGCSSLTSLDLSHFDTQNVTTMEDMFNRCSSLKTVDVSNFCTQHVTNMVGMFSGCTRLNTLDVSNFDTKNVADMRFMFSDCSNLATIYCNSNWDRWMLDSGYMFQGCTKLKGAISYKAYSWDAKYANPDTGYFIRTATAISKVEKSDGSQPVIYDLQGRRLTKQPQRGVYIRDGKRVMVK